MTTSHIVRPLKAGPARRRGPRPSQILGTFLAILLSFTLLLNTSLTNSLGAPQRIIADEGTTQVRGLLTNRHDRHYLGLQADDRFTTVHLTMTVELLGSVAPLDLDPESEIEPDAAAETDMHTAAETSVNFLVLTEMGLQRFLNGADPWNVNLAAGTLVLHEEAARQGETRRDETLQLEARFRAVGRGGYTVLVYNTSDAPAVYRLHAAGGKLIDGAGQTHPAGHRHPLETLNREISLNDSAAERFGQPAPTLTALPVASLGRPSPKPLRAEALSGHLNTTSVTATDSAAANDPARHYFVLEPTAHNGEMTLSLAYEHIYNQNESTAESNTVDGQPQGEQSQSENEPAFPRSGINFWVFTEAGVRQLDQGAPAEFLSLASGVPFLGVPNLLRTKVRLTGQTPYVIVVYNDSQQPVDYRLRLDGGNLVDLYSQSKEAQSPVLSGDLVAQAQTNTDSNPSADAGSPPEAEESRSGSWVPDNLLSPELGVPQSVPPQDEAEDANRTASPDATDDVAGDATENGAGESGAEVTEDEAEPTPDLVQTYRLPLFHVEHLEKSLQEWLAPVRAQETTDLSQIALDAGASERWRVQPDGAFSRVVVTLHAAERHADPTAHAVPTAPGARDVRIWVVSTEGLRRVEAGITPDQATVAGFSVLRLGRDGDVLQASFDPVGYDAYTIIIENTGEHHIAFDLNVRNGVFSQAETDTAAPRRHLRDHLQ